MSSSAHSPEVPDELSVAREALKNKGAMEKVRGQLKGPLVLAAEGLRKAPGRDYLYEKWASMDAAEKRKTLSDPSLFQQLIMLSNPYSFLKGLKGGFDRQVFACLLLMGVIGGEVEDESIAQEFLAPDQVEGIVSKLCSLVSFVQPEFAVVVEALNVKALGRDQLNQLFIEVREEIGPVPTTVAEEHNKVVAADPEAGLKKAA